MGTVTESTLRWKRMLSLQTNTMTQRKQKQERTLTACTPINIVSIEIVHYGRTVTGKRKQITLRKK